MDYCKNVSSLVDADNCHKLILDTYPECKDVMDVSLNATAKALCLLKPCRLIPEIPLHIFGPCLDYTPEEETAIFAAWPYPSTHSRYSRLIVDNREGGKDDALIFLVLFVILHLLLIVVFKIVIAPLFYRRTIRPVMQQNQRRRL
ncbi:hypothetical protein PRIPAC_73327 [Pristionchus pacificus]|uniref:Uncharacterized protein n=1 Tax=Pristionchus pacificus TaxID=54126 RepID=A0A454Y1G7_PRIPA|nr:hypothetical protein PRIPAC_73327 [Pristionchus pacificus]|eukprot:PDM76796.1 hypothetical protein PRIPAC_42191 [Pristionchus pacificus]